MEGWPALLLRQPSLIRECACAGPPRGQLRGIDHDCNDIPDAAMTLAVAALFAQVSRRCSCRGWVSRSLGGFGLLWLAWPVLQGPTSMMSRGLWVMGSAEASTACRAGSHSHQGRGQLARQGDRAHAGHLHRAAQAGRGC